MKTRVSAAFCTTVLLLAACVPSVNPFYSDDDIVQELLLLGEWVDGSERWVFEPAGEEPGYELTITEDGDTGVFWAVLFSVGGEQFLDLMPVDVEYVDGQMELVEAAMVPGHLALHVRAIEPQLELALMDPDWVVEYVDENPRALEHRRDGDRVILTGKTRELQRFLRRHLNDGLFDSAYSEMERVAPTG